MTLERIKRFRTPSEIIAFHERREVRPTFSWLDVSGHERAHFFTVAKATDPELLETFKRSITEALVEGHGFATWQRILLPKLAAIGWDRPRLVEDPLGQRVPEMVDFTNPDRLQSILWANTRIARSAREWGSAQRTALGLPYIVYLGPAPIHPPSDHGRWTGLILPAGHPWWAKHWPPNGWGCTCHVLQVTRSGRDRYLAEDVGPEGRIYKTEPPDDGPSTPFLNKRTGRRHEIPAGLEFGWDGNPGLDRESAI